MSRISADIKWMPLSNQGFNYILFATCEISERDWHTYTLANAATITEALLNIEWYINLVLLKLS